MLHTPAAHPVCPACFHAIGALVDTGAPTTLVKIAATRFWLLELNPSVPVSVRDLVFVLVLILLLVDPLKVCCFLGHSLFFFHEF